MTEHGTTLPETDPATLPEGEDAPQADVTDAVATAIAGDGKSASDSGGTPRGKGRGSAGARVSSPSDADAIDQVGTTP